jgi:hypothetical protein
MQIKISDANASQLAEFATTVLGIETNYRAGADKIRSLIAQSGYSRDVIDIDEPEQPIASQRVVEDKPRKRLTILIQQQNEPGGKEPVLVGVNGKVARIQRGVPVEVPEEYVEALRNANRVVFDKGPNGEPINPSLVPTHPFSVIAA